MSKGLDDGAMIKAGEGGVPWAHRLFSRLDGTPLDANRYLDWLPDVATGRYQVEEGGEWFEDPYRYENDALASILRGDDGEPDNYAAGEVIARRAAAVLALRQRFLRRRDRAIQRRRKVQTVVYEARRKAKDASNRVRGDTRKDSSPTEVAAGLGG